MVKHTEMARTLLVGCSLWTLAAIAQDKPPENQPAPQQSRARGFFVLQDSTRVDPSGKPADSEKSGTVTLRSFNSSSVLNAEQSDQLRRQIEERQAQLRAQLADPKQRAQLVAERIEQQRALNVDLAALVRLDTRTEEKLLALLVDQQLSQELTAYPSNPFGRAAMTTNGKPYNPMRDEAERYTQRMAEIGKVIGAARLDDYVDYQRKLGGRMMVGQFDQLLPSEQKLSFEQRTALADLFHQSQQGFHGSPMLGRAFSFDFTMSEEERNRRMRITNIVSNERFATVQEAANREFVDRATSILTPEQITVLSRWKQQQLDQQRAWTQAQRRELGVGPDEALDLQEPEILPSPPISKNLRLSLTLTVNDTQVTRELTSVRGAPVTFDAPEGLRVELRPYMAQDRLMVELKWYEKVRGGTREIGRMGGSATLDQGGKPSLPGGSGSTIVQGRKGYGITWSVSGTYQ